MQAALPDWTRKLVAACRASMEVRPTASEGETFEALLEESLSQCMGRPAALRVGAALALGHRGVLAARQGNVDAAVSIWPPAESRLTDLARRSCVPR